MAKALQDFGSTVRLSFTGTPEGYLKSKERAEYYRRSHYLITGRPTLVGISTTLEKDDFPHLGVSSEAGWAGGRADGERTLEGDQIGRSCGIKMKSGRGWSR